MGTKIVLLLCQPDYSFGKLPETAGRKVMGAKIVLLLCQPDRKILANC